MRKSRRFLGLVFLLLGGAGVVLCAAGVVGVWSVKGPLRARFARAFDRADHVLGVAHGDLRTVRVAAGKARKDLDAARAAAAPATGDAQKHRLLMKVLAQKFAGDLGEKTGDLRTTVSRVAETAVVLNGLLEGVDKLSLAPSTRLDAQELHNVSEMLARVTRGAQELGGLFAEGSGGEGGTEHVSGAERVLDRLEELTETCDDRVVEADARLGELQSAVDTWTTWGPPVVTALLIWMALGQAALLLHGRSLLRGKGGAGREADPPRA